jgi:hypothetical protein
MRCRGPSPRSEFLAAKVWYRRISHECLYCHCDDQNEIRGLRPALDLVPSVLPGCRGLGGRMQFNGVQDASLPSEPSRHAFLGGKSSLSLGGKEEDEGISCGVDDPPARCMCTYVLFSIVYGLLPVSSRPRPAGLVRAQHVQDSSIALGDLTMHALHMLSFLLRRVGLTRRLDSRSRSGDRWLTPCLSPLQLAISPTARPSRPDENGE